MVASGRYKYCFWTHWSNRKYLHLFTDIFRRDVGGATIFGQMIRFQKIQHQRKREIANISMVTIRFSINHFQDYRRQQSIEIRIDITSSLKF